LQSGPGSASAEQGLSDTEDEGSLDADGVSDDAQEDMQDEVMSDAPAAAATPAATALRRRRGPRTYTDDEQAVMRELNLSNLGNIVRTTLKTITVRWRVKLCAEGLSGNSGTEGLSRKSGELSGELSLLPTV
jgi:hypothetical protein